MAKRIKDKRKRNNSLRESLKKEIRYMRDREDCSLTEKDKAYGSWIQERADEIIKTCPSDSVIFLMAARAVSEMERLYDHLEYGVVNFYPEVNVEGFFRTIKMYIGKNGSNVYHYLTDWKTLMYTIAGNITGCQTFPILGCHFQVIICKRGYFLISSMQGQTIAIIPIVQGVEKTIGDVYPQHGEPLENGNLEYTWEDWYELNKLENNEKEWFKMMKYYDEVFNYIVDNDLFNKKKVMPVSTV